MIATRWPGRGKAARLIRLGLAGIAVLTVLAVCAAVFAGSRPAAAARHGLHVTRVLRAGADGWVTSWSASPQPAAHSRLDNGGTLALAGFDDQTVRDIVFTSVGGDPIRIGLSNLYGTSPLRVGRVTVGVAGPGASVQPGTIHSVTFGGSASLKIPAGGQVLSDPVAMRVRPLQDLAVSVYLPGRTGPATFHHYAQQVNWVSAPGDHAAEENAGTFALPVQSSYYVSELVVRAPGTAGTVVAFGDSITDGVGAVADTNGRWPNDLARRLDADGSALAVADAGIGGNRVLTGARCCGASAEARFQRDVLDQPGVRDVIVLEGINDIGLSPGPDPVASAAQIIAGYQQLIAQAHARGLRIFGATLLPFQGAGYYSAAGEAEREAVNTWIRTGGAFDGVIDFDAVMRDPAGPLRLNPAYDSGDHLHPDNAGYQAMADAVSLEMLLAQPRS